MAHKYMQAHTYTPKSNLIGEQRIQMQAKNEIMQAIKCAGEHAFTQKQNIIWREREREIL